MEYKNIAVFCGSSGNMAPEYCDAARALARALSDAGITLVYGGATVGLMGIIADEMLRLGSTVIGVIPRHLVDYEIAHEGLSDLHIVDSMHERKLLMSTLADAFIMLPGGIGSVEEFFEIVTWNKLGLINKPVGILNTQQYFNHLLAFLEHMVEQNFFARALKNTIHVADKPDELLQILHHLTNSTELGA
jgi:uncharacterized protein (TIGR00730 family)